jgi:methylenetetrahydrofolate reductase (NADPH)
MPISQHDHQSDAPYSAGQTVTSRRNKGSSTLTDLKRKPNISFEFFPPANEAATGTLRDCLHELRELSPQFVSVTYGAGGTTQGRTRRAVANIADDFKLPVAAHMTCVGVPRQQVDLLVQDYADMGVRRVVALRGDSPDGQAFTPHPEGYQDSVELIASIARREDFDIAVGCYPERHPDASSASADLDQLKRKQDAGATRAISQFFFDADVFLRFVDRARAAGITLPIIPGILPVRNFAAVQRIAGKCGTHIPAKMAALLAPLDDSPDQRAAAATSLCAEMCLRLQENEVQDFHFYTLNHANLTRAVCSTLHSETTGDADIAGNADGVIEG